MEIDATRGGLVPKRFLFWFICYSLSTRSSCESAPLGTARSPLRNVIDVHARVHRHVRGAESFGRSVPMYNILLERRSDRIRSALSVRTRPWVVLKRFIVIYARYDVVWFFPRSFWETNSIFRKRPFSRPPAFFEEYYLEGSFRSFPPFRLLSVTLGTIRA